MFGKGEIAKQARVIATAGAGPIVEIRVSGKHRDGCGDGLIEFVSETVRELKPSGVVVNLSSFKYGFGNDIGGLLFPLLDHQTSEFLPFCIVAGGRTAASLRSLFDLTMIPEVVNARYFERLEDGVGYLEKRLGGDTG